MSCGACRARLQALPFLLTPRPGRARQVYKEITYQVRRLDHHASLAIWGGNNEIEVAFGWFPDSRDPDKARLYAADYNQVQAVHRAARVFRAQT